VIYSLTFVLAFCSIVYELLLGQALSAFLGNTVLRYSVTIGLYMMSLGIGSMIAEGRFVARPAVALLRVETLLTLFGGGSVVFLFFIDSTGATELTLSITAHLLIIIIGVLSGFEIPLLIALKNRDAGYRDNAIIGINYLGAFLGTMTFAFVLYPYVGLIPTAFVIALLNAAVGISLLLQKKHVSVSDLPHFHGMLIIVSTLALVLVYYLIMADHISELVLQAYLN
jgi:spermidine synthase